jgi:hypothetical protein
VVRSAADGLAIARAALAALAARWRAQLVILAVAGLLYLGASALDDALLQRTPNPAEGRWMFGLSVLVTFGLAASAFPAIAVAQRVLVIADLARARMPSRPRPSTSSVARALCRLLVPSAAVDVLVVIVILLIVTYEDAHVLRVGVAQFWLAPLLYWAPWMARRQVLGDAHAHIAVGGRSAGAALRASMEDHGGRRAASVVARVITVVPVLALTAGGLFATTNQTLAIALAVALLVTSFDAAIEAEWYGRLHDTVDATALCAVFD